MRWLALFLISLCIVSGHALAQDEQSTQSDYIIEAYVTNDFPYVGEQIRYVVSYYTYTQSEDVLTELPEFTGFWLTDVYEAIDGRIETVGDRQYIVKDIFAEISPLEEGQVTIAPSSLDILETVFRPEYTLETEALTLNVQPLPEGAPETFRGAVGAFNARIEVDPLQVTLGEPVTLTMTIDGTGNLEQLSAPRLPDSENWRAYSNPSRYVVSSIGGLRFGQKVFEWLLIPKQAGTQVFPPITFTYFDPQLKEYVSTDVDSFSVSVLPGEGGVMELSTFNQDNDPVAALPLRNFTLEQVGSGTNVNLPWILWLITPGVFFMVFGYISGKDIQRRWHRAYLQRYALQNAQRSLNQLKKKDYLKVGQDVQRIYYGYFIHRLALENTDLSENDLGNFLAEHSCSEDIKHQTDEIIRLIEDVQFAPAADTELMAQLIRRTRDTLELVDECLQ